MPEHDIDEVGPWTEMKLHILREYAGAYAKILKAHNRIKHFAYIDGFAGAGEHISKTTGKKIDGSPRVALKTKPGFSHYHFIDLDGKRTDYLKKVTSGKDNVSVYTEDCKKALLEQVFPQCRFEHYRRGLCLLDPYDLNIDWEIVETAGQMQSIEIFLNFMIMDANRNVLWKNPKKVSETRADRMTKFWGDSSWRDITYQKQRGLFGDNIYTKRGNKDITTAYRNRLKEVAGFKYVPKPMPMKNTNGAIIYYLFFASNNKTGSGIASDIFSKWQKKQF